MTDDLVKRLRDYEGDVGHYATLVKQQLADIDRIEALERAMLDIFDYECRTSSTSLIACTARDALWPNSVEKKDER